MPGTNSDAPFAKWMAKVRFTTLDPFKFISIHICCCRSKTPKRPPHTRLSLSKWPDIRSKFPMTLGAPQHSFYSRKPLLIVALRYINDPSVMQSCVQSGSGFQGPTNFIFATHFIFIFKAQLQNHFLLLFASNASRAGLILGDVLFRTHVVMFDASDYPYKVMIGIGKQNPAYKIGAPPLPLPPPSPLPPSPPSLRCITLRISLSSPPSPPPGTPHALLQKVVASKTGSSSGKAAPTANDIVPVKNFQNCQVPSQNPRAKGEKGDKCFQFFVNISVGTPRQELTVILDRCAASSTRLLRAPCLIGVYALYFSLSLLQRL
jgi:hypothetical protein